MKWCIDLWLTYKLNDKNNICLQDSRIRVDTQHMNIECPHCKTDNPIAFADHIKCIKCEKDFKGIKFKKAALATTTAIAIGCFGGYNTNNIISDARYPLEVEYAIVDTCVNGAENLISTKRYEEKRDACLCALSATAGEIDYSSIEDDLSLFAAEFKKHSKACKKAAN